MTSNIRFSICILLIALGYGSTGVAIHAGQLLTNEQELMVPVSVILRIENLNETEVSIQYDAVLNDATSNELGRISFSFNKLTKTGYISRLHVLRTARRNSYGSVLLRYALKTLTHLKCTCINWMAFPFDLAEGQTQENMLPKLIAFYQRHGALVLSQTGNSAQMAYYPDTTPRFI